MTASRVIFLYCSAFVRAFCVENLTVQLASVSVSAQNVWLAPGEFPVRYTGKIWRANVEQNRGKV